MTHSSLSTNPKHKTWLRGLLGVSIGMFFFWLALRQTSWTEVLNILREIQPSWILTAIAFYMVSLAVRVIRWRRLMWEMKPLSYPSVGLALLVGYAMNNLLPARLGELFRADFAGRRHGISRSAVIGSIAVERTIDGLVVVLSLVLGRLFIQNHALLNSLTVGGFILFASIFLMLLGISSNSRLSQLVWLPGPIINRIRGFQSGLSGLKPSLLIPAVIASLIVWVFEGLAHWSILQSLGVALNWQQMLSLIGVVNLSTLIPSAPGFAGTYQYAYAFTLVLLGHTRAQGVAAATTAQIFLLGSTTLFGLGTYTLLNAMRVFSSDRKQPETKPTKNVTKV
ncbi:MAG: flippase-like domain-containing protein [Leptolyngbya sp. SIO1D8]|nr:flippase-like domain-containing protein [Leptolyngbya sp. SIO1D8]